ncbi:MAG: hypothetical protein PWQ91_1034 [Eubacteriales bacterium]|nr:hypothetical protein [Eubacteriales bacterium]
MDKRDNPVELFAHAARLVQTVDLKLLSEMLTEQALLISKLQVLVDSIAEYREEVLGEEVPDNPFRVAWEYRDGLLKIVIPGHLPKLNYYSKDWRTVRDSIVKRFLRGLKDLPEEIRYRRACCVFKMFYCLKFDWDAQNRAYQSILNALCIKKILPNDTVDCVISVLAGEQIEKLDEEKTEVYLFPPEDFEKYASIFRQL